MVRLVHAAIETWPLAHAFRISRGAKTRATVVIVVLSDGGAIGRGEATPYPRYGETAESVHRAVITACRDLPSRPEEARAAIACRLPPGAARNAADCALWDLAAKRTGLPAWRLAGSSRPSGALTCYTLSLDSPDLMARAAASARGLPLLKLKLGAGRDGDTARMRAVRKARPDARLVVDANEGWCPNDIETLANVAAECGIELIEQPLPAGMDQILSTLSLPVPICADESAAPGARLELLAGRYDAVNIKLDKAGGLSGALQLLTEARRLDLKVMVGSMVATSLGMAPALALAESADWVDLDSPLLLARDRARGLRIAQGWIAPAPRSLWG